MKQKPATHRIAIVALFASAALSTAPVYGQDAAPVIAPLPPPTAAVPPPVPVTPPVARPAPATPPAPVARATPPAAEPAARRTTRVAERVRTPARVAPAPAADPAPVANAPEPALPPVAETPAPAPVAEPVTPLVASDAAPVAVSGSSLVWLIAGGAALLLALIGLFAWRRRRAAEEGYDYDEPCEQAIEPVAGPVHEPEVSGHQPQIVAPTPAFRRPAVAPAIEEASHFPAGSELAEADSADMEALAAGSAPEGHRPWLEFLMRPVRAGTSGGDAVVEFELTVGNTGTAAAEDVRISTWMFAGDAKGSEMERSLIEPPVDAVTSETRIAAGDGARVDATIAVPRAQLAGDRLPVVVADARYRLPDGGEGRTAARFAVGLPSGDGLAPFAVALGDGLRDDIEVRLAGEPEHA